MAKSALFCVNKIKKPLLANGAGLMRREHFARFVYSLVIVARLRSPPGESVTTGLSANEKLTLLKSLVVGNVMAGEQIGGICPSQLDETLTSCMFCSRSICLTTKVMPSTSVSCTRLLNVTAEYQRHCSVAVSQPASGCHGNPHSSPLPPYSSGFDQSMRPAPINTNKLSIEPSGTPCFDVLLFMERGITGGIVIDNQLRGRFPNVITLGKIDTVFA